MDAKDAMWDPEGRRNSFSGASSVSDIASIASIAVQSQFSGSFRSGSLLCELSELRVRKQPAPYSESVSGSGSETEKARMSHTKEEPRQNEVFCANELSWFRRLRIHLVRLDSE